MPKGVEHMGGAAASARQLMVSSSVMPKGVEHLQL